MNLLMLNGNYLVNLTKIEVEELLKILNCTNNNKENKELKIKAEYFRKQFWAWNKLINGRLLNPETSGWSKESKLYIINLIKELIKSRNDISFKEILNSDL